MKRVEFNIEKFLYGIIIILMLAGCKSSTNTTKSETAIIKTEELFFNSIVENSFQFRTFSARLKIEFTSPKKELSSRAQLKIIHNDRLQISLQPMFGIEMFRIEITNDSIKFLDRMNKYYMTESLENVKKEENINFNFQNLQALFTNNLFLPGEENLTSKQFKRFNIAKTNTSAKITIKDNGDGLLYSFTANGNEKLLLTSISDTPKNKTIIWKYDDFQDINEQTFPMLMNAKLLSGDISNADIKLSFSNTEVNNPLTMDFNIPQGYKEVKFSQIAKLLKTE